MHDKSPRTISLYLRTVGWFTDWLKSHDRPKDALGDLAAVSRQDAEAWFADQRANGLQTTTIRSRWIGLRSFYGWAHEEEEIDVNPMARIKMAKADPPPIELLTADELTRLFKACAGKDFYDRRDLALIRLVASAGLRSSEVGDLHAGDVDLAKRVVYVRAGKGDKGRFGRFDQVTAQALDRYKRTRSRHRLSDLPWLFLTRSGKLSKNALPDILARRVLRSLASTMSTRTGCDTPGPT